MEFIGNYSDWLKPEWVDYVLTHEGKEMPKYEFEQNGILESVAKGERAEFCEYQKKYEDAGYKHNSLLYYIFEQEDLPFKITLPPFVKLKEGQGYYWNLFKYKPGHLLPIHSDRAAKFEHNCERFWMPWLDYTDGHVYIYKDTMLSNYKAGDVFKFPDPFGVHGAANISLTPRITFQITTFDIVHDR